ncbi:FtsX-like permease family protein [Clostridium oryzae]|uniref:Bacitracin export permease protein BceB n=1 Tax=Clostridium oryzae TaxID=1450648 RepID=A0A1V4IF73_9CLOT|nr:ABC transporter permease [Clostridium oryzae]OPJ58295.1 bacitracin export permease protein BceB [Clostridium oryzae]
MNSFSIAFGNFKRNMRVYGLYIMSMIFSVLVYYNFVALRYNPDFMKFDGSTYIKGTSQVVTYLLLLFLIFFIWFSSSFFLSQRKKEIGIYAFMGVTNFQIASIYFMELIFMGIAAITVGLLLGIMFCKLFLMMLAKVAIMNSKIRFFISIKAVITTAVTFFIIFFINSLLGYINISRSKLIDLFNASKREEKYPKASYIKGVLSIISIGIGYYFARNALGEKFITNIPLAIVFVVLGTYWFFGAVYSIIMKIIIGRKRILYKGVNIVTMSNIAFRIKNNFRTLAAVCVLVAMTLTAYGTVASLKYFVGIRDSIQTPYSISYISDDATVKQKVADNLKTQGKTITMNEKIKFLMLKPKIDEASKCVQKNEATPIVKYSDLVRISRKLNAKKTNYIQKNKLQKNKAFYIETPTVVMSLIDMNSGTAQMNGKKYSIISTLKTPLFGNGVPDGCLILNDEDYNKLKSGNKEYEFNGIRIDKTDDMKKVASSLSKISEIKSSLFTNISKDKSTQSTFGIIYFLGAFLSIVFIVATGSIIYFKLVSEAYIDKNKYTILKRVGMTKSEMHKSVQKQIGISYILPLIVGIIHSCVAMSVLSKMMNYNIIVPAVRSIIIFVVVYGIYFLATTRKYLQIAE